MTKKSFFGGVEGFFAKFLALVITLAFYIVYVITDGNEFSTNWFGLAGTLVLFVSLYEGIGYILYLSFRFFARNKIEKMEDSSSDNDIVNFDEK